MFISSCIKLNETSKISDEERKKLKRHGEPRASLYLTGDCAILARDFYNPIDSCVIFLSISKLVFARCHAATEQNKNYRADDRTPEKGRNSPVFHRGARAPRGSSAATAEKYGPIKYRQFSAHKIQTSVKWTLSLVPSRVWFSACLAATFSTSEL